MCWQQLWQSFKAGHDKFQPPPFFLNQEIQLSHLCQLVRTVVFFNTCQMVNSIHSLWVDGIGGVKSIDMLLCRMGCYQCLQCTHWCPAKWQQHHVFKFSSKSKSIPLNHECYMFFFYNWTRAQRPSFHVASSWIKKFYYTFKTHTSGSWPRGIVCTITGNSIDLL